MTPERQKPLDEVRDAVVEAWTEDEISKKVGELADQIRDRAAKGEDFAKLAEELLPAGEDGTPAAIQTSAEITRNDSNAKLTRTAVTAGFSIPEGDFTVSPGAEAPGRIVLKVAKVVDGEPEPTPENVKQQLEEAVSDDILSAMVADLRSRGELQINQRAIDAALSY